MTTLRLLIDPAWPQEHTDCTWYLCDRGGRTIRHGHSEPRHWPGVRPESKGGEAVACDVILTGGQTACFQLVLPKGAAGRRPEVVAAAVEELLLDAPEDCQYLVLDPPDDANGASPVAVIAATRLAVLCRMLADLGLAVRSAWPDGLLLPESQGRRCARAAGDAIVLPTTGGGFLSLDAATLAASREEDLAGFGLPLPMPLRVAKGAGSLGEIAGWAQALMPEAEADAGFPLRRPPAGGFLHGKFAPPRRRFAASRHFWPALRLSAGMAVFAALLILAQWAWFALEAGRQRSEVAQLYRQAFPQGALVDPALQMQRQIDVRRRALGRLGNSDFLNLMGGLATASGAEMTIGRLDYEHGRLQVTATLPSAAVAELLLRLRQQAMRAEIGGRQEQGGSTTLSMTMTYGGAR